VSNRYLNVGLNYFLYCSGFGPNTNWQRVMEAFSEFNRTRLEPYQLVFAGIHDPGDLEQLKRLTYDLGLSKDTFVLPGYVSDLRLARLFAGATALVTPSLYEGFGLPAAQAMRAGVPVIASNRSSHPEVVEDAGILVTPESVEEITEAMRTLADDPALRRRLGERGIQSAQRFSVENQARAVLEVYTGKPWKPTPAEHTEAIVRQRSPASFRRESLPGGRPRPKIHWFCPVPPAKTAIAHYSMGVLRAMQKTADVTVWVSQEEWSSEVEEIATVRMFHPEMLTHDEMAADATFYHIGNNIEFHKAIWEASQQFPGTTILHDINVMGFFEGYYLVGARSPEPFARILKQYYGAEGVTALRAYTRGEIDSQELVRRFPLTEHAYRGATGVIAHTPAAEAAVREQSRVPVLLTPLPYADIGQADDYVPHRDVPPGEPYRLVVFGHISYNRRVEAILKALAALGERAARFRLDIYGAVVEEQNLRDRIAALGLRERVTLHGFVSDAKLNQALADAHLALNLRYPTMGESSYSQLQLWDHALPALVTKTGYYATLPQETVAFVHPETEDADIQKHLLTFLENPAQFAEMGRRGHEHLLVQHRPEQYADAILSFVLSGVKA
jgi:glycosyltransferase involved in cell wall biosynthesis